MNQPEVPRRQAHGTPQRILLVGMMGAGKTTVGRLVAEKLGWDYLDSDAEVERATGSTVPQLLAHQGEPAFREAEAHALHQGCVSVRPVVISVAGGAVLRPDNRALLSSSGKVVWLRARPDTLASRVGDGSGRPLLDGCPRRALAALDSVRRPVYSQVADEVIDVDELSPEEVVSQVIERCTAQGGQ